LQLNSGKAKEMVIRGQGKRGKSANLPAPCPGIELISSICILGVTLNDQLSAADYVNSLMASSKSLLYALRVLRVYGIPDVSLQLARGFPRHSLGEDDVRRPRMAWHVLSRRSHET